MALACAACGPMAPIAGRLLAPLRKSAALQSAPITSVRFSQTRIARRSCAAKLPKVLCAQRRAKLKLTAPKERAPRDFAPRPTSWPTVNPATMQGAVRLAFVQIKFVVTLPVTACAAPATCLDRWASAVWWLKASRLPDLAAKSEVALAVLQGFAMDRGLANQQVRALCANRLRVLPVLNTPPANVRLQLCAWWDLCVRAPHFCVETLRVRPPAEATQIV